MSEDQMKQELARLSFRCLRLEGALCRMDPSGSKVAAEIEAAALEEYPDLKAREWKG